MSKIKKHGLYNVIRSSRHDVVLDCTVVWIGRADGEKALRVVLAGPAGVCLKYVQLYKHLEERVKFYYRASA